MHHIQSRITGSVFEYMINNLIILAVFLIVVYLVNLYLFGRKRIHLT